MSDRITYSQSDCLALAHSNFHANPNIKSNTIDISLPATAEDFVGLDPLLLDEDFSALCDS